MKLAKGPYILIGLILGLLFGFIGDNFYLYVSAGILVGALLELYVAYEQRKKIKNHDGGTSMTFSDLFLSTLSYIGVATVLLAIGVVLFEVTTKSKELELIRNGKKAAVYAFGGRILGLAIVLYSSISNSVSILDMVLWGALAIVLQIVLFYLADLLIPRLSMTKEIDANNEAVGLLLLFLSISIGLIIAGSLTY